MLVAYQKQHERWMSSRAASCISMIFCTPEMTCCAAEIRQDVRMLSVMQL